MRSIISVAALLPAVLAFNPKICKGAGGCVQITWNAADPFRCPDGTLLNLQQQAHNELAATNGAYEVISKDQFPTSCLNGAKPSATDILAVHTTEFNQKMYVFLRETCTNANPEPGNCYSKNPNPSSETFCQLVDASGQKCIMNPRAGECERWGSAAGRNQCIGWTPAKPEPLTRD
ncbi:hypothetical protein GQ44DRAFT_823372 [Phaeosphaeriaceae sp. PMI808]|nr:hypothetical protein GQ44DRAFT_823372 [Phaeosphaeriaceae sp. PMI808]